MKESLDLIYNEQKELSKFGGIAALLGWDQMTYMPTQGAAERSDQISLISRLSHEKFTSDKLWNHVKKLAGQNNLEKLEKKDRDVVLRLEQDIEKSRKVPSDFVEKAAKTTTLAYAAWQEAREKSKFPLFAPHLEKIVGLEKEYCRFINLPGPEYNSLLDDYEEGMTVEKLKREFDYLKPQLIEILEKITSSDVYSKQQIFNKKFGVEKQREISNLVIKKMNLPNARSRVDVSTHPFTTSMGNDDVRITTNFEHENPLFSFLSTVHEGGHALYELGLPQGDFKDTVISDSPSLGLHESQSRFWENMIARNKHFWKYFYPVFEKSAPEQFKDVDLDTWYGYVNQVRPSLIRVEADELTYCLHVILRFEIELALIDGEINVSELPGFWNEKMDEMLGVTPKNDREGVLQDMHWSGGSFGYFPTYALGTIYASQLFKQISEERPGITGEIEQGDFTNILAWLREHIHKYGRLMTADEIIKNTCGEGLNSKVFIGYLKDKYYPLYEV
ncbi:MAG: carboxypeptidase M32 [Candidatus Thermoplasmatota archaeon]|nr:carboxypeptidase M32 [Candidatus Thermoplasmatota archaeon]